MKPRRGEDLTQGGTMKNTNWVGSNYRLHSGLFDTRRGGKHNASLKRSFKAKVFATAFHFVPATRGKHCDKHNRLDNRLLAAHQSTPQRLGCRDLRAQILTRKRDTHGCVWNGHNRKRPRVSVLCDSSALLFRRSVSCQATLVQRAKALNIRA
jgi:hypothetical protein